MQKLLDRPVPADPAPDLPRRGRGRLRAVEVQALEADLIAAAREAFTTLGYGATSMAALARQAGVSKTTLYAKYPTKAALFRAVIDQQLDRGYGAVTEGEAPGALADGLGRLAETTLLAALSPENVRLNRLVDWEAQRFPEVAEAARARARISIDHIARYIRDFADRDGVPCRDPEAAARIFSFMVRGLYYDASLGVGSAGPRAVRATVKRIVADFLASRPSW